MNNNATKYVLDIKFAFQAWIGNLNWTWYRVTELDIFRENDMECEDDIKCEHEIKCEHDIKCKLDIKCEIDIKCELYVKCEHDIEVWIWHHSQTRSHEKKCNGM